MRYLLLLLLLAGCNSPPCPAPGPEDKLGLFSKELGTVNIDGESCRIIETYQNTHCQWVHGSHHDPDSCSGSYVFCYSKTLTRVTKCPSFTSVNGITRTPDKFNKEVVQ